MDILLETLKDKTKLITFLLETIQESQKEKEGLTKLSESLTRENPNLSAENLAKCLATTMKVSAKQSHSIQNLAIISLIVCQSPDFDSDITKMMIKMGRGQEAVQQMWKNKMNGK